MWLLDRIADTLTPTRPSLARQDRALLQLAAGVILAMLAKAGVTPS